MAAPAAVAPDISSSSSSPAAPTTLRFRLALALDGAEPDPARGMRQRCTKKSMVDAKTGRTAKGWEPSVTPERLQALLAALGAGPAVSAPFFHRHGDFAFVTLGRGASSNAMSPALEATAAGGCFECQAVSAPDATCLSVVPVPDQRAPAAPLCDAPP
jgi:hypothetical protein